MPRPDRLDDCPQHRTDASIVIGENVNRYPVIALLVGVVLGATGVEASADEGLFLTGIRQLTFDGRRAGEGYFSADGSQMVFQSERDPSNPFYQIYLMDLETGDVQRVSAGFGKTTCAWVHPGMGKALYASTHEDPAAREKMRAELDFRASGQERRYSWDYDEHFEIYEQDLETGQRRNLTNALGYDAEGSYSPDGSLIAFASNRRAYEGEMTDAEAEIFEHDPAYLMDIYLMNADGSGVRRLTDAPGYDGGPFFSPDGGKLTWRRFSADGSTAEIYLMDLASGQETRLTGTGVMSWAPYFHPSGDYLIYAANQEGFGNFELYLVDADGANEPVRVTHTDGFDGLPVFSPNGGQLAWTSNRTADGNSQIFLARWDDAAARAALGLDGGTRSAPALGAMPEPSATSNAITTEDARLHVARLTAEDMAGRLTGTTGERLATDYVAGVFEALGLEPGGGDGGFFQSFPFTAGASLGPDNRLHLVSTEGDAEPEVELGWRPLALSRSGAVDEADVVFVGYGIIAPEGEGQPAYDSYGDLDVSGKWVLMFRFQPESVTPERRRHLIFHSSLAYKASWARRKGAVGMIVVTGPTAGAKAELVPLRMGATSSTSSIAGLSISDRLAGRMLAAAGEDLGALQARLDDGEHVEGYPLPGIRIGADIDIVREQRDGRNVIGVLRAEAASRPPIVLGAHVDHLGRGEMSGSLARDEEKGQIHPGADDNASGVAALLEAAEYLTGMKAAGRLDALRDIWFVAWSGEELGTLGSSYFVEQLAGADDLEGKVAAYLNMDMIGRMNGKAYLQGTGSSSRWAQEIERRNVPVGLPITTSADPYLPTDSTPFYLKRVPVLTAFTGVHEEYSTPRDTADRLSFEGIRDITRLMAGITRSLAISAEDPDYLEVERTGQGGRASFRVYLGTIPAYGEEEGLVGVKLQGAVKGSPAETAGVTGGDILVGLAGVEIENIYDFMTALGGLKAGEQTEMTVLRDGERVTLEVVPGSRE